MLRVFCLTLALHMVLGRNLVQVLQSSPSESTLVSLVQKAGLAGALGQGTFTIFAPSNAAFAKLPADLLASLNSDVNALANVLKYHVVQGSIQKKDASNEAQLDTLAGSKVRLNIYSHNHVITVEGSTITNFDIEADNGYIHVIDTVMLPPEGSIVDIASGAPELSVLLSKVKSANLVSALQGDALTVFAPTDDAFQRLGSTILNNLASNPQLLKEILEYHVVPHTEYSAGLYNREYLRTLDTHHDVVRIGTLGSSVYVNNARVTKADIAATNGVVHIIDHKTIQLPFKMLRVVFCLTLALHAVLGRNLVQVLQSSPSESTLVSLVQKAGLADALGQGTFTIFAPSNAAFAKLPADLLASLNSDVNALANVLKYHVVPASIQKKDASNEAQLDTLAGSKVRLNIYSHNNVITVEGSTITNFDIQADNGYIHVIDTVMLPPEGSIVDIASSTPDLSVLLSKVKQANLVSALQGDALTVFAPTNDAFQRLGSRVLNNLASNPQLLKEILEYHVVPHTEYSAGLYNREHLRTLDTHHDVIRIGTSGRASSSVHVNTATVTKADIGATNGVVHIIDHVLVPLRFLGTAIFGKK
ncbi:transforming growth factor-beta-induced protein ig-h3-like [Ylistrum balloti]|uniref:transforming growth factor-beta-induced protein ig-h3-like n=1 Tax=Ylistrum balloti TaxID=509963 RepID=UPI002905866C|nr:transforming growth factor-beta-induced protein ig-h3-like [Ylistrum balloti]